MIYIIGGMGYVGSGFTRYCRARELPHQLITRENYQEFVGTSCDGGSSLKATESTHPAPSGRPIPQRSGD